MRHEKFLYPDLSEKDRVRILRDTCDAVRENHKFKRGLTDNEIQQRKEQLSEQSISLSDLVDQKKAAAKEFDEQIKPLRVEYAKTREEIKSRQTEITEDVYIMLDTESEIACEYSKTGELINKRMMNDEERQHTILSVVREEKRAGNGE